ncbi:MAG: NYN domain-containing protein, partial [Lachnospiraceae bacterium]|nr:NYN domain-containing protein [Lachnospiraceae bacterium]
YQSELNSYTGGKGSLTLTPSGYDICHNADEVMESFAYDPEADIDNPSSSVFCSHGTGFIVTWESVPEFKHVEDDIKLTGFEVESNIPTEEEIIAKAKAEAEKRSFIGTDEIDGILERTLYANRKVKKSRFKKEEPVVRKRSFKAPEIKDEYLLIDGYNVLFSWDEAAELLKVNIDGAKQKLIDKVCNYAGRIKAHVILVFDAYHVMSHPEEVLKEGSINIVYTKTAQTADSYIERFATDNAKKYLITVATSDRQEQIIIRSQGCRLLSAREFLQDMNTEEAALRRDFEVTNKNEKIFLTDVISKEAKRLLDEIE